MVTRPKTGYYQMNFQDSAEAAAFVAALSRFLSYPQGSPYLMLPSIVEVYCRWTGQNSLILFLSADAIAAATAAFGSAPNAQEYRGETLPADCKRIMDGTRINAWGIEQAQQALAEAMPGTTETP